jgi:hypothetical protein
MPNLSRLWLSSTNNDETVDLQRISLNKQVMSAVASSDKVHLVTPAERGHSKWGSQSASRLARDSQLAARLSFRVRCTRLIILTTNYLCDPRTLPGDRPGNCI